VGGRILIRKKVNNLIKYKSTKHIFKPPTPIDGRLVEQDIRVKKDFQKSRSQKHFHSFKRGHIQDKHHARTRIWAKSCQDIPQKQNPDSSVCKFSRTIRP
jgi:hypothetical protein